MLSLRRAADRGRTALGWLDSRHTFSFADYVDPDHMGHSVLRVINDDRVTPGGGFGTHGHRDMEIVSYVLDGSMAHRDSTGEQGVIRSGEVQLMRAGTGINHSEMNASDTEPLRFLQIWIIPDRRGLAPGYQQRRFFAADERSGLRLAVSSNGEDGSLAVAQDVRLWLLRSQGGDAVTLPLAAGRRGWVQVARGAAQLGGMTLAEGDGVAIDDEPVLVLTPVGDAEILIFDLP